MAPQMDAMWLVLNGAVFLATLLQATTGIGFGILAGPVFLLMLAPHAAIPLIILLSLAMALMLALPGLKRCDMGLLRPAVAGGVIGFPLGLALFLALPAAGLKLGAGVIIAYLVLQRFRPATGTGRLADSPAMGGALSGTLSACLAMPGPPLVGPFLRGGADRETARASLFAMLAISYLAALALHGMAGGLPVDLLGNAAWLLPATLAGTFAGQRLAPHLPERLLAGLITLILTGTSACLLATGGLELLT